MAILDCVIFHPEPNGSAVGSNKVKILCLWKGSKKLFHIKGNDKINIPKETPINLQLKPAKNNTYNPAINITKLVPKSG